MRHALSILGVLGSVVAAGPAAADNLQQTSFGAKPKPAFMRVYGSSQPPYGFVRFCELEPGSCQTVGRDDQRHQPTPETLSELDEVNRSVNHAIQPATDQEIYGVSELWTLPSERGDCEDYALLKQKILVQRGWPSSSLLITVVRDEKGEGHAVLTARTVQGDYVLDNKVDDVKLWSRTGYDFVMRQSYIDPRVWVSLDPASNAAPSSLAGTNQ